MAWCSVKAQGQLYLYNDAFSTAWVTSHSVKWRDNHDDVSEVK
jgi:hypothetical protein